MNDPTQPAEPMQVPVLPATGQLPQALQASGISGGGGLMALFASHPPIEERIAALSKLGATA